MAEAATAVVAATLFCWLAVVTMDGSMASFDETVRTHVHASAAPWLTTSVEMVTWLGAWSVLALFSGVSAAILLHAGRSRDAKLLLFTMAGAVVLENALKFSLQRPRPPPFFGTDPTTYSFPSGHALFSLCFYGVLATFLGRMGARTIVWPAMFVLVAAIGGTRIYLGVHYPTDVVAGYLVATAWLCTVLAVNRMMLTKRP
jgi:undecaprenyl-diphosphatase